VTFLVPRGYSGSIDGSGDAEILGLELSPENSYFGSFAIKMLGTIGEIPRTFKKSLRLITLFPYNYTILNQFPEPVRLYLIRNKTLGYPMALLGFILNRPLTLTFAHP